MKMYVFGWNRIAGTSKKTGRDYDFYAVDGLCKRFDGDGIRMQGYVATVDSTVFIPFLNNCPPPSFLCSLR